MTIINTGFLETAGFKHATIDESPKFGSHYQPVVPNVDEEEKEEPKAPEPKPLAQTFNLFS